MPLARPLSAVALLALCLAGCNDEPRPDLTFTQAEQSRLKAGAEEFSRTAITSGEVIELRLPDPLLPAERSLDRRCLVFRDFEFKTSSISCLPVDAITPR